MKINGKSLAVSIGLLAVLLIVLLVESSIFISGPSRKYEEKIDEQMSAIRDTYKEIKNLHRDAFYYITYVGEDADNYVLFNDKGKAIVSRKKDTDQTDKVKQEVQKRYGAKDIQVALGYGYDNPVYAVECSAGQILLDYDSLKEVYFLKKGEA